MTAQECQVLMILAEEPRNVVPRMTIIDKVWRGNYLVGQKGLTDAVYRLRKAIGDDARDPIIVTVPRRGYRLDADVRRLAPQTDRHVIEPSRNVPGRKHWKFVRKLGSGHVGQKWLVQHSKVGSFRVLKLSRNRRCELALRKEATVFGWLRKQVGERGDIVPVLDWDFENDFPFIEFPYVSGGNLKTWFEAQSKLSPPTLETRLSIAASVADALAATHSAGVVHNGLKPENVLMADCDGRWSPMLCNFGAAEINDRANDPDLESGAGTRATSCHYLAPELLDGRPPSTRSDNYAFGVLLYQLLTGDFSNRIKHGWERDIAEPLLRNHVAGLVDGNPDVREADLASVAERLRNHERELETCRTSLRENARRQRTEFRLSCVSVAWPVLLLSAVVFGVECLEASRTLKSVDRELAASNATVAFLTEHWNHIDDRPVWPIDVVDRSSYKLDQGLIDNPDALSRLYGVMGTFYDRYGAPEKAAAMLHKAIQFSEASTISDASHHYRELGVAMARMNRDDESLEAFGQSMKLLSSQLDSTELLDSYFEIVEQVTWELGHPDLAQRFARLGMSHLPLSSLNGAARIRWLQILGLLELYRGDLLPARSTLIDGLELATSEFGPIDARTAALLTDLAVVEGSLGSFGHALDLNKRADAIFSVLEAPGRERLRRDEVEARLLFWSGQNDRAREVLERLFRTAPNDISPQSHAPLCLLFAMISFEIGDYAGSASAANQAIRLFGPNDARLQIASAIAGAATAMPHSTAQAHAELEKLRDETAQLWGTRGWVYQEINKVTLSVSRDPLGMQPASYLTQ